MEQDASMYGDVAEEENAQERVKGGMAAQYPRPKTLNAPPPPISFGNSASTMERAGGKAIGGRSPVQRQGRDKVVEQARAERNYFFQALQDSGPGRFHALDALLAQALIRSLPQNLASRVKGRELQLYHADKTITGRQVAWLIYDWFKTEALLDVVFGFADIVALTWYGVMDAWRTGFASGTTSSNISRSPHK